MKNLGLTLIIGLAALSTVAASAAETPLNVLTTLPVFASICDAVGGRHVQVTSLLAGDQDPHSPDRRPGTAMFAAGKQAELLIHNGLGMEDAWLPSYVIQTGNPKIQKDAPGNLDASTLPGIQSALKENRATQAQAPSALLEVHPGANPHYMLDPRIGIAFARAIAGEFSKLRPKFAADFKRNADQFETHLAKQISSWEKQLAKIKGAGVVGYHAAWPYFLDWAGLTNLGTIESKPGAEPDPEHIVKLARLMRQKKARYVFLETYRPKGIAHELAAKTGAHLKILQTQPSADAPNAYERLFGKIVQAIFAPVSKKPTAPKVHPSPSPIARPSSSPMPSPVAPPELYSAIEPAPSPSATPRPSPGAN